MKICEESRVHDVDAGRTYLDIDTIRRRVARIKQGWTPEMARSRSAEGRRRRRELEDLVLSRICDTSDSEESCDLLEHGFSLVG